MDGRKGDRMTKLTESELDLAIAKQRLEHCDGKPLPVGLDQQGRYATRQYKPSEHYVDPAWSECMDEESRPPPEPFDGWIIAAAFALGASVLVLAIIGLGRVVGWVATL
jgi:hypothetical protein